MNEHDKARPVSGEIMAGAPTHSASQLGAASRQDAADADFETVGTDAPGRPPHFHEARPATGMETLKRASEAAAPVPVAGPRHGGPLFWSVGLLLVALAFWVSGGHALVSQAAIVAPAERLEPLRIGEVKSRVERHGERDVLFVDGDARNHGEVAMPLPPIEIAVTAVDGATTHYHLSTNGAELKPGGRYAFSSRLEAPAGGVKTVSVTFLEAVR